MSDENPPPENENQESGLPSDIDEENESGGSLSLKKIVLFAVLPILLLFGVGGGLWVGGVFGGGERAVAEETADGGEEYDGEEKEIAQADEDDDEEYSDEDGEGGPTAGGVFYELPEMLVNLTASSRRASFLKIKLSLELNTAEDVALIEKSLPRITDNFQVYLRELRAEDLKGSAGIHRLREELLTRLEVSARPAKVRDILFKEVLVQ